MTRAKKVSSLVVFFGIGLCFALQAQNSLFDNQNYRRSIELQRMAKSAYDSGDYLKSVEYSNEAKKLSQIARSEAEVQLKKWTANSWKNRAASRIAFGDKVNAATRYPDIWPSAKDAYAVAESEYAAAQYDLSVEASKKVIDLLAGISAEKKQVAAEPAKKPEIPPLPEYYVVRLIESKRDCFWRIAEYPFVYGDPLKWPLLYKANEDKIPNKEDPDLILPGMIMLIPSLDGETRAGTWSE